MATKSVLLKRNGGIIDTDGLSTISFEGITASSVYVAVRHRNHFGIRTSNTYDTNEIIIVDFSDSNTSLYGVAATTNKNGLEMMIAGDANIDGQINPVDKNSFWRLENGQPLNYMNRKADFNLDGAVNPVDKNGYWRVNNSKTEQLD